MSFPRYPEYKDSGVEWLGEVPGHWDVVPLGRTASGSDSLFIDGDWIESKDLSEMGIRYLTSGNVGEGLYKEQGQGFISEATFAELNCVEVFPGDVLISRLNLPIGRACIAPDLDSRIVTCVDNVIVRPNRNFDRRFFVFLLTSKAHFANMENLARGTTMQRISRSTLGHVRFAFPPGNEQTQIAAFLDRETTKIDGLMAEQRRLMALLKEKRQAVISHAVTQGLNPYAPMKPSGIEWLGDVPTHWEVRRVKSVSTFTTSGPRGWSEHVGEEGSLFVQSGDLNQTLGVDFASSKRVNVGNDAEAARTRLCDGDVVVCITGAKTGNVAVCVSVPEAAYINQHLCLIRPTHEVLPVFLGVLLKGNLGQTYFDFSQYGLKQGLSLEDVREAPVLLPPLTEQSIIVSYVGTESAKFDTLTAEAQRAIDLLAERRTALISAAVTGQIDVRGVVASL